MKKAPKISTSKSKSNKSNKEVQKLAGGGLAGANEKLAGKENLIGAASSAGGDLALLGGTALAANNQVDEQGNINVNKSTGAGALTGAGTGIKTGAAIGSVFGPAGTLIGAGGGALIGGTIGAVTGNKKAKKLNEANAESILEQQKLEKEAKNQSALAQAMNLRNLENYADGGQIKGKGTAKSDSIKAKVKEGSFIVPTERAEEAEEIREKVLVKAPTKKANLKQSGGEEVKLSNGEHLFTPEEVHELMEQGIDLDKLAPDAKNKLGDHLNCGGKIKGYKVGGTVNPTKERQKIEAEEKALAIAKKEYEAAKLQSAAKAAEKKKIYEGLLKRSEAIKETSKEAEKAQKELDALNKSYENYVKDIDAENKKSVTGTDKRIGVSKPDNESVRERKKELLDAIESKKKEVETLQATTTAAKNDTSYIPKELIGKNETSFLPKADAKKTDFVTTDNTVTPQLDGAGRVESGTGGEDIKFTPRKAPVVVKKETDELPKVTFSPNEYANTEAARTQTVPEPTSALAKTTSPTTPSVIGKVDPDFNSTPNPYATQVNTNTSPAGGTNYDKIGSVLAQAMSYGVPIAQTAIGMRALNKAGARPVNTIPSDYLGMIDQANATAELAKKNAGFGFTPEEQAMLNQQNQNATNAQTYAARNLSGGSAANALNNTRSALADSYGRNLQTKVQNRDLMLKKQDIANERQRYANELTAGKTALLNNIFDQKLQGWMQTQQAGGALVGSGLKNTTEAARYNEFLKQQKALNA